MVNRIIPAILLIIVFTGLISCKSGSGSTNPTVPYLPPMGGAQEEPEIPLFPYDPVDDGPLPDPIFGTYYETSTVEYGRAIIPGFALADKRSQAYLPMKVSVVESDGDPLRHKIVRRILLGDEYVLIVWDPTGFYNPRFLYSETLSRTLNSAPGERSAKFVELLGVENPATTNIGIGSESIDITVGLDRVSMLDESSVSTYMSYYTDQYMLTILSKLLESGVFASGIVKYHGTYGQYQLPDAISTMTDEGALILVGGFVDLENPKLSTFRMGTAEDGADDDNWFTNPFVTPRFPTDSSNSTVVFSSFMQVAAGTDQGTVKSAFESAFGAHPLRQSLGSEQRYIAINFRPIIDINPEIITAPVVRTNNLIIILPLDPLSLNVVPSDGSIQFSSGVVKILEVTADYATGATYPLSPYPTQTNWFKKRLITTLDPIFPGDVISQPGSGLLPSVTMLAELDRNVFVTHFVKDYSTDENLLIQSNILELVPFGGSVSNLPPDLSGATVQPSSGRAPLTVTFDATGAFDQDGSIIYYQWNFGNPDVPLGGISEEPIAVHLYGSPGTRTAVLTVKDDGIPQNTVQRQFSIDVRSNQPPVAVITPIADTTGMAPFTVQFDGTQSYDPDGNIVEFRWDFGEGLPSFQAAPEYTFTTDDDYLVTLRVTDDGPSPLKYSEDSIWIHVLPESTNQAPVAGFTADPESGNAPLTVQFDSSLSYDPDGQNLSYQWFFGDIGVIGGGQSTEANPVYIYEQAQVATVTLRVTDDDDYYPLDNSTQKLIEVNEVTNQNPIALFDIIPDSGQAPLTVTFDASDSSDPDGNITGYSWDFGDGSNEFGAIVEHIFSDDGVWDITLTIADNASPPGTGQAFGEVVVGNTRPVAVISNDVDNGEVPLTVHFDATGSSDADGDNLSYHWNFGDLSQSTNAIVDHVFTTPGQYYVILTVTDDHGTPKNLEGTDTIEITADEPPPNQPPVVVIDTDQYYGSSPLTVQFDCSQSYDPDGDDIVEYYWDFGDSIGESFESAPEYTYNDQGEFLVVLRLTDSGNPPEFGMDFQGIYVDINVPPVSVPEADVIEGEQPLTVQFTGENSFDPDGSIISYFWDFATGDTSPNANQEYTFDDAGEFWILLQVTDDAAPPGMGFEMVMINVLPSTSNEAPVAVIIANPTDGPAPLEVNFSANSSSDPDGTITTVLWNFGDPDIPGGGESSDFVTSHIYESSGDFMVTLTVWDDGTPQLSDVDTINIHVS